MDGYYISHRAGQGVAPRLASSRSPTSVLASVRAMANLNWYDRQQLESALTAQATHERRGKILNSMFAAGSTKALAEHLADRTDVSADAAIACLEVANGMASRGSIPSLSERLGALGHDVGAVGILDRQVSASGPSSFNELAAQIYASRKGTTK